MRGGEGNRFEKRFSLSPSRSPSPFPKLLSPPCTSPQRASPPLLLVPAVCCNDCRNAFCKIERVAFKRTSREAATQRRPAQSEGENRVFSAKRQAVWFGEREAFQTEKTLGLLAMSFLSSARQVLMTESPRYTAAFHLHDKARLGKVAAAWGEENPLCASERASLPTHTKSFR